MNKYRISFPYGEEHNLQRVSSTEEIGHFFPLESNPNFVLRLGPAELFAIEAIADTEKIYSFCKKLVLKQLKPKEMYDPDARMDISLLEEIEDLGNVNELYYTFFIDKTDGNGNVVGKRKINAPEDHLKEIQRRVVHFLRDVKGIKESEYAYAYVKGRSYVQGAEVHAEAKHTRYANVDIENFFPSITPKILRWALKDYDLTQREIDNIVRVSTWYDKENRKVCFPQGSVTSPYLSNLVFYKIDHRIVKMLEQKFTQKFIYTRYCDDITISSLKSYSKGKLLSSLSTLLGGYGFKLKNSKTKFTTVRGKNIVTGLRINKNFDVTVGHKRKKWLKKRYHSLCKQVVSGTASTYEVYEMLGELSFLYSVEPDYHQHIINKYNRLFGCNIYVKMKKVIK